MDGVQARTFGVKACITGGSQKLVLLYHTVTITLHGGSDKTSILNVDGLQIALEFCVWLTLISHLL